MRIDTAAKRPWVGRLPRWDLVLPCLLIVLMASPLVWFMLPSNFDSLKESFEPLKTLKFIHSKGRAFHKWGPMPAFVYAPVYAPAMAYWYVTGQFGKPSEDYPYGFPRPHEQMGVLIALARLTTLAIGVAATAYLGWVLARATGSRWAGFLAVLFCVATSPELIDYYVATKPDGLMLAFLAAAMGVYTLIVWEGLTLRKGVALSILAVFSVSCKELTALVFVLPYVGIAVVGWLGSRGDRVARRRFLGAYAATIAAGLVAYALINIVYAPATWQERMRLWLMGPGKDPEVWAPPGYTTWEYLLDVGRGLLQNFDAGGLAVFALAMVVSAVCSVRNRLMFWLPTVGFLVAVILTAGYMPAYFLTPVNLTATLPVAACFAYLGRAQLPWLPRRSGVVVLILLAGFNLWGANAAWARPRTRSPFTSERYCLSSVNKNDLVFLELLWVRQPGIHRLTYLGFNVDDRPLGELMSRPERMPDVIIYSREGLIWLADFDKRPARNAAFEETGFSYIRFSGFEPLGYRLTEVVSPRLPWPIDSRVFPWYAVRKIDDLMIYRRQ
jgi:hypothetical protein